jgi:Domain of unknown function (DUF1906)
MAVEGVDYAGSRPDPAGLYRAGKRFVVRYGGPGGSWKHLTATEANALRAAGLSIVANAEGTADGLRGRQAGADWAILADEHFRSLGMPADRPIYLSADWDVTSGQWPSVADALRGAGSVIGAARVGVYGSYDVMRWARRDGVARWFWQTYAWSGGRWAAGNHIEQYGNGIRVAGGDVDLCRALTADYGQWGQTIETEEDVSAKDVWQTDGLVQAPWPARTDDNPYWAAGAVLSWGAGNAAESSRKADVLLAKVDGLNAILGALAEALKAGGGDLDTAAVLARLDGLADQLAAAKAERDELRAKLAAAVGALLAQGAPGEAGAGA